MVKIPSPDTNSVGASQRSDREVGMVNRSVRAFVHRSAQKRQLKADNLTMGGGSQHRFGGTQLHGRYFS